MESAPDINALDGPRSIAYHTALRDASRPYPEDPTVNFEIQQETLQKALDLVSGVVPGKTTLPILTCVLIEADEEGLKFSATNLDISLVTQVREVEIAEEGRAAVPSNKLVSFVRSLAPGSVQVTVDGGKCTLRAGKASFEESCMNAEEYPSLPAVASGDGLEVPGEVLSAMIAETSYSVSRDETRPALMGILWEVRSDGLTMVATDAHRLARSHRAIEWSYDGERNLIVDTGGLRHLPRITGQGDQDATTEVFLGENQLSFRSGDTLLHIRLLEGPFPEYNAVIPKNNDKLVVVDREALAQAIRRVSITADRITSQIKLGVESGRLELSARGSDGSRAEDEVPVSYDGDALEVGFNFGYLLDILKNVRADSVQISLRDPQSAALVAPLGEDGEADPGLLCLLMPLRLAGD
ncbi:DNA polymerase III subunit beta [bacterium]|nr:DNA polymerase III subunit beta [bacterium]